MDNADHWLQTNTYHHRQFSDRQDLVFRKKTQQLTVSLCIPTLNEASTIGSVISRLRKELQEQVGLLDEIAVIDSGSVDQTLEFAAAAGAEVYRAADILPQAGSYRGKGENLWKAVYQLKGDILLFLDGDITNMHPRFVTGLLGPLLHRADIGYVKSFYARPACHPGKEACCGGGRVTELLIRPFFSLYYPDLSCVIQPLSGEYAVRRSLLEQLHFPVGYGVETAHLIDVFTQFGLQSIGQTDLEERRHRNRSNIELGRAACAILQVLDRRRCAHASLADNQTRAVALRQFHWHDGGCQQEITVIDEHERPPLCEVPAYRKRWGLPAAAEADGAVEPVLAED